MKVLLISLFCCCAASTPTYLEDGREAVEPEYLDYLLREEKYEEFNRLMGIDIPHLSKRRSENAEGDPRYNPHLEHGDIVWTPRQKEQGRNAINFTKWPGSKWSGGTVPCYISSNYSNSDREYIWKCIQKCNQQLPYCVNLVYRSREKDYCYIYPGDGCFSNLGRVGGQQSLSLDANGCLSEGTICHELLHALGLMHEQCREDRDKYIRILWENIYPDWRVQFQMVNKTDFILFGTYDYYSLMHYPQNHSQLCKPGTSAFKVLDPNCDVKRIGNADAMTDMDIVKIEKMYC